LYQYRHASPLGTRRPQTSRPRTGVIACCGERTASCVAGFGI